MSSYQGVYLDCFPESTTSEAQADSWRQSDLAMEPRRQGRRALEAGPTAHQAVASDTRTPGLMEDSQAPLADSWPQPEDSWRPSEGSWRPREGNSSLPEDTLLLSHLQHLAADRAPGNPAAAPRFRPSAQMECASRR